MTDIDERLAAAVERLHEVEIPIPRLKSVHRRRRRWRVASATGLATVIAAATAAAMVMRDGPSTISNDDPRTVIEVPAATTPTTMPETASPPTPDSAITDLVLPGARTSVPAAPISARVSGVIVWTGSEVIVWGGHTDSGAATDDGAAYNVTAGAWRTLAAAPIAARHSAAAVWTGEEMIVWGGTSDDTELADGAAYDPHRDVWRALPSGGPAASGSPSAVWTGTEMITIGGSYAGPTNPGAAAYDPVRNEWRELSAPPVDRVGPATAVWFDEALYVFGLERPNSGSVAGDIIDDVDALVEKVATQSYALDRYDPVTDTWNHMEPPTLVGSLVATNESLLLLDPRPGATSSALDPATLEWRTFDGPPRGTPYVAGDAVWTGRDVVFADGGDVALIYRPSSDEWATMRDGTNWNRAANMITAVEGLVARWSGFSFNPTATVDASGALLRTPDDLLPAAPLGPAVAAAAALADVVGASPDAGSISVDVPDLGWTVSFSNGHAFVRDENGVPLGGLAPVAVSDDTTLIGAIGETPPPSGRWTIAIVSTAPRLAVLPQPDDDWVLTTPTSRVEIDSNRIYIYVVDGGEWTDGFGTTAYPA